MGRYKKGQSAGKVKNLKAYHLVEKSTGNVSKYWIYGFSPSDIEKRKGTWDKRTHKLVKQ